MTINNISRHTPEICPRFHSVAENPQLRSQKTAPCVLHRVRFSVVRDLLVSRNHQHFLDSNFSGLEPFDVNLGRDAVLGLVPVQPSPEFRAYPLKIPGTTLYQIDDDDFCLQHFAARPDRTRRAGVPSLMRTALSANPLVCHRCGVDLS